MNILVMGGTEFLSSSLVKYLLLKGHRVDIFTRGIKPLNYTGVYRHHKGNRKSKEDLEKTIKNIQYDYVFDISAYDLDDVESLFDILDVEKLKRYIFCSSGAVYEETNNSIKEDFNTGFNKNWGDYGLNKLAAEKHLMNLNNSSNIPVVIFRTTYIYGSNNNLYRESYIFDRLTNSLDIPIPSGEAKTQFIYIDDIIKTFEAAMYEEKCVGEVYNVTHPEEVTWEELINTAIKVVGKDVNIVKVDATENSREYFPFRNCTYLLDINKLIEHNLYIPQINLLQGLILSYKWYTENKPRLKDEKMKKIDDVLKGLNI